MSENNTMHKSTEDTGGEIIKACRSIFSLSFPPGTSKSPVISNLSRFYDLSCNIIQAQIDPREEGHMTVEICGSRENLDKGIRYLKDLGVNVDSAAKRIRRDEELCIDCGMCTAMCATGALSVDGATRRVLFDKEKCTACGLCNLVCPVKAMEISADKDW